MSRRSSTKPTRTKSLYKSDWAAIIGFILIYAFIVAMVLLDFAA